MTDKENRGFTMRLPRKLKKGCRTLQGNPHTKWQRKGQLHISKLFDSLANTTCVLASGMDLLRQAGERINTVPLPPGGIIVPTERMMMGESTGEIILHRPQLDRLKVILVDPVDTIRNLMGGRRK